MNKRQKKKREKLYDSGCGSWKEKRRIDKQYKDFMRRIRHVQEKKDWVFQQKARNDMSWAYERLDELVESGEISEEEARQEYREWITEQIIKESEE